MFKGYKLYYFVTVIGILIGMICLFQYNDKLFKADIEIISDIGNVEESIEVSIDSENNNIIFDQDIKEDEIRAYVCGEVKNSGVVTLKKGTRVEDAVKHAGGVTDKFYDRGINLARVLKDEDIVIVPSKEDGIMVENGNGKVNINTAKIDKFIELDGIGESTAKAIINYRNKKGSFKSIEELLDVDGIGPKKLENIIDRITIE